MPLENLLSEIISTIGKVAVTVFVGTNIDSILYDKYTLQKCSKYEGQLIVDMPPTVKPLSKTDIDKIQEDSEQSKVEMLLPTLQKLKENVSEENLKILYSNLKTAKFKKSRLLLLLGFSGYYYGNKNTLKYAMDASFGHELLHLSSAMYDHINNIGLSGFRQFKGSTSIGTGINEGYTELLASRFFRKNKKPRAYHLQVKIAKLIESLFDDPKELEKLYFNCDLPGLIHHLEKYSTRNDIMKLILDIDKINSHSVLFGPMPTLLFVKTQLKLRELYMTKNKNQEQLNPFGILPGENTFVRDLANNKEFKLNYNLFVSSNNHNISRRTL
ncbi:MAG: hypothetical protein PHE29_12850 [Tissierellia bacterium]|nr:hypothetical protein [Tissierellia bacterium]